MNDVTQTTLMVAGGALILWICILYWVIASASKADRITKLLETQAVLLARMAANQGVDTEEVNKIMKSADIDQWRLRDDG